MRLAILAHERFPHRAKTAVGVLRYGDEDVVAVLDRNRAGARVHDHVPDVQDAPIVSGIDEVDDLDALVVGIAPIGGGFDESWRDDVRGALERGADVVSGLHYFLADDPEFSDLADRNDCTIWDVRKSPEDLSVAAGVAGDVDARVVLTVGTDCSTGKMTTTMELHEAATDRGLDAAVVPTGQTGIVIEDWGIAVDRTVSDFTAGAVERMVLDRAADHDLVLVEGQGAITHPAYSAVTCGILHGAMPDAMVLCHTTGREAIHGYGDFEIPPVDEVAALYESVAAPVHEGEVVAGALDTRGLAPTAAEEAVETYGEAIGGPATDPVRFGADRILDAVA